MTPVIFGTMTLVLWKEQVDHKRESILRHTNASAEQIRVRVAGLMDARFSALGLLVERWVERDPPDFGRKRFTQFGEHLYSLFPGFSGINWADPQGVVRWVYPEENRVGISGDVLTIRGEKKGEEEKREERYYCRERYSSEFQRAITLPASVKTDQVEATYKNGVLKIDMKKSEKTAKKR